MSAPQRLVPERNPFFIGRMLATAIFAVVLVVIGLVVTIAFSEPIVLVAAVALGGVLLLISAVTTAAAFKKESYEIKDGFIRATKGGLFSDAEVELDVRNITHVKQYLPWVPFKLFGVGDLLIESAGSADSEVRMRAMTDPDRLYAQLQDLMQENGYSLRRGQLLHQEQPNTLGVILELIGIATGGLAAIGVTLFFIVLDLTTDPPVAAEQAAGSPDEIASAIGLVITVLSGLASVWGVMFLIVRFLDMRQRTYSVYDDVVVYEEGFLTRTNAFIPYENVADAEANRTFVDQILGLYDVKVSCQGGGSEVKFRRLRQGDELMGKISGLVEAARKKPKLKDAGPSNAEADAALGIPPPKRTLQRAPDLVPPEQAWTAELKMHMVRALLPVLPLMIFPPAAFVAGIGIGLRAAATRYSVRRSSVRSTFKLLSVDEREFAYDKITGLVISESFIDRWMGTVSIKLWSIGSPLPLEMLHIKKDTVNLEALRRQVGIPAASPSPWRATTSFSAGAWVKANIGGFISVLVLAAALIVAGLLVHPALLALGLVPLVYGGAHFGYRIFYFSVQRLELHDQHLFAQTGRLFQHQYFVRYPNIKKVQRTRYPGGDLGRLTVFVAGEQVPPMAAKNKNAGQAQNAGLRIPYSFTAHYLEDIEGVSELLDEIMLGQTLPAAGARAQRQPSTLKETQPAIANAMVLLLFLSVITTIGVVLFPISIPWLVIAQKRKRYVAEDVRAVSHWGILYKSRASILYDRIDSLKQSQGLLGKVFKNGKVTVLTAGSSQPDLVFADLPDHKAFYDVVRQRYGT
jgi:uncharacterized membrane protein YdbT with pleckstrin-like domain